MDWIISKVIVLGLTSAISPMIFAASILLISEKNNPRKKLLAFAFGGFTMIATISIITSIIWGGTEPTEQTTEGKTFIRLFLGLAMLTVGIYSIISNKKSKSKLSLPDTVPLLFGFGFIMYLVNFKSILINLVAIHEILDSNISFWGKITYAGIADAFFILPSVFPLLVHTLAKKDTERIIQPIRNLFEKYSRHIIGIICIAFGIIMLTEN